MVRVQIVLCTGEFLRKNSIKAFIFYETLNFSKKGARKKLILEELPNSSETEDMRKIR